LAVSRWMAAMDALATSRSSRPLRGLRACANRRFWPIAVSDARVLATLSKRPPQTALDQKRYGETGAHGHPTAWGRWALLLARTSSSPGSRSRTACCGLGGVLARSGLPAPACAHQELAPLARAGEGGAEWMGRAEHTRHRLDERAERAGASRGGLSNAAMRGREQAACVAGNMRGWQHNDNEAIWFLWRSFYGGVCMEEFYGGCSKKHSPGALPPHPLPALRLAPLARRSAPYVSPIGHPYCQAALKSNTGPNLSVSTGGHAKRRT
jgi:hypothetical protein